MTVPLDELRFLPAADVYKAGRLAGALERRADGIVFRYAPDYVAARGEAVATTLPLVESTVATHAAGALPPFFAGLLPEGRRLTALRRAVKTSADDELSLLLAVGADVVGDVQVVPADATPGEPEPKVRVDNFDQVSFATLYSDETGRSLPDRVGLPGVQEKVSTVMIALPIGVADGRFILKLDPPELPHLVENEAFFLDAARRSGLPTAEATVVRDRDDRAGLLVRRFDRVVEPSGEVRALAQEDACQVLNRYPADKYTLTAEKVATGLIGVTRARPVAARDVFRQLVFAYVSGNGDAHAKNFSVHCDVGGEWRIAPAYDLPSSYFYGDHTMALRIDGRMRDDIGRPHMLELGRAIGLRPRAAEHVIDDLVERMPGWVDRLDELPFDARRIHKFRRAVAHRRERLVPH